METRGGRDIMPFATQPSWEEWLEAHYPTSPGIWLKIAKKDAGVPTVTYPEALDVALCYGWIDGQKGAYDDSFWLQRFTPRGPRSKWSRINRDRAIELEAQGRIKPSGRVQIERAKADGRWDAAYDSQSRAVVPEDLQQELDKNPAAKAFFETLNRVNRYAILFRLHDAKRPETRTKRIATFIAMLNEQKSLYPQLRSTTIG